MNQFYSYTITGGQEPVLRDFRRLAEFILSDDEGLGVTFGDNC